MVHSIVDDSIIIGEINIICTDLNRSLRFYHDILGFEVLEKEGEAIHLKCGNTRFLLLPIAGSTRSYQPYGQSPEISVDLLVDDLSKMAAHLQANDVVFASAWEAGKRSVVIRDPDGLVFEVIQKSPAGSG